MPQREPSYPTVCQACRQMSKPAEDLTAMYGEIAAHVSRTVNLPLATDFQHELVKLGQAGREVHSNQPGSLFA